MPLLTALADRHAKLQAISKVGKHKTNPQDDVGQAHKETNTSKPENHRKKEQENVVPAKCPALTKVEKKKETCSPQGRVKIVE